MKMVETNCSTCGKFTGMETEWDFKFMGEITCWGCLDEKEYAEFLAWEAAQN